MTLPTINLTARTVDSLKPIEAAPRIEYWDDSLPGFGIRLSTDGRKSWVLMYRFQGRQRRLTLGTFPALSLADARLKAKEALLEAARGTDPASVKAAERTAETFEELSEEYLTRHAKAKKRSWKEDERIIKRELLPRWKNLKAKAIQRREVIHLLDGIVDRGAPIQANRVLALARKVFNFGIQRDLVSTNPCWQIPAPGKEKRRDRVLSPDELKAFWKFLDGAEGPAAAYFKILLLTAQRPGEVALMRWIDIDLSNGWWTIPGEFAKNQLPHRVPLSKQATATLKNIRLQAADSDWVFPGRRWLDPDKRKNRQNLKRALNELRESTRISFRPHDLRRTAASYMTSLGIPRLVVSKLLNHVEKSVTSIYDRHSYDAEKRQASQRWEQALLKLLTAGTEASSAKQGECPELVSLG